MKQIKASKPLNPSMRPKFSTGSMGQGKNRVTKFTSRSSTQVVSEGPSRINQPTSPDWTPQHASTRPQLPRPCRFSMFSGAFSGNSHTYTICQHKEINRNESAHKQFINNFRRPAFLAHLHGDGQDGGQGNSGEHDIQKYLETAYCIIRQTQVQHQTNTASHQTHQTQATQRSPQCFQEWRLSVLEEQDAHGCLAGQQEKSSQYQSHRFKRRPSQVFVSGEHAVGTAECRPLAWRTFGALDIVFKRRKIRKCHSGFDIFNPFRLQRSIVVHSYVIQTNSVGIKHTSTVY